MRQTIHFLNPYDTTSNLTLFSEHRKSEHVSSFDPCRTLSRSMVATVEMPQYVAYQKKMLLMLFYALYQISHFQQIPRNNATFMCLAALLPMYLLVITVVICEITPDGYYFFNFCRKVDEHGGIGIVYKSNLNIQSAPIDIETLSFEYASVTIKTLGVRLISVYRPPPSDTNQLKVF